MADLRTAYFLDFIAQPLQVGDRVVTIMPRYRQLVSARVEAMTAKKVKVIITSPGSWRDKVLYQDSIQLVRVDTDEPGVVE